jgi:hypothetical protein
MTTDYKKWQEFSDKYDSDGDEKEMKLQVPLEHVSPEHLASGKVDPKDITMSCGTPMDRAAFEEYCARRGIKPKTVKMG